MTANGMSDRCPFQLVFFYAELWKGGRGKGDALWRAKMALRAEGRPIRDWAAWVLSGDPR